MLRHRTSTKTTAEFYKINELVNEVHLHKHEGAPFICGDVPKNTYSAHLLLLLSNATNLLFEDTRLNFHPPLTYSLLG